MYNYSMENGRFVPNFQSNKLHPKDAGLNIRSRILNVMTEGYNPAIDITITASQAFSKNISDITGTIARDKDYMISVFSDDINKILSNKKKILMYSSQDTITLPTKFLDIDKISVPRFIEFIHETMKRPFSDNEFDASKNFVKSILSEFLFDNLDSTDAKQVVFSVFGEDSPTDLSDIDKRKLISELDGFKIAMQNFDQLIGTVSSDFSSLIPSIKEGVNTDQLSYMYKLTTAIAEVISIYTNIILFSKYRFLVDAGVIMTA